MRQLSGIDASFLYMETPNTYGHINGLGIYQRPHEDFDPFEEVRARFSTMVGNLAPFRRRLVEVPFGLDHPYWVDDPNFELDYHVRQIGLARPGTREQLCEQVGRIIGRKMDRERPLWEVYVIDGLRDGRWGLLTKYHHSAIDGAAGVEMLRMMTEASPDEPWKFEEVEWEAEAIPEPNDLLGRTAMSLFARPVKVAALNLRVVRSLAEAAGMTSVAGIAARSRDALVAVVGRSPEAEATAKHLRKVAIPVTPAPPTPWNGHIGPHRRFAMREVSLNNLKVLKNATNGTINDVVMAMCAGALRNYLIEHDALPEAPLRGMVPVSIRTGDEQGDDIWTNRVTSIIAELPTDEPDPVARIQRCREAMLDAKNQLSLVPADALMSAVETTSPVVAVSAARLAAQLADRVQLSANLVISNVPGPREPLYFAGCQLDHYIPISMIAGGMGLNITVHSYMDRMVFGLVSDRQLVPDLEHLVDLHVAELADLMEATGSEWAEPPDPSAVTQRPAGAAIVDLTDQAQENGSGGADLDAGEKARAEKTAANKAAAENTTAEKTAADKTTEKKAPAKATAKKAPAKKAAPKKTAAKKSAPKKAAAQKVAASESTAPASA